MLHGNIFPLLNNIRPTCLCQVEGLVPVKGVQVQVLSPALRGARTYGNGVLASSLSMVDFSAIFPPGGHSQGTFAPPAKEGLDHGRRA